MSGFPPHRPPDFRARPSTGPGSAIVAGSWPCKQRSGKPALAASGQG
ncbi:hypothetical protein [Leifsonia xyli]|nr:hypothetical protein [Leifsonia xyli]